jgi:hypothetical protein
MYIPTDGAEYLITSTGFTASSIHRPGYLGTDTGRVVTERISVTWRYRHSHSTCIYFFVFFSGDSLAYLLRTILYHCVARDTHLGGVLACPPICREADGDVAAWKRIESLFDTWRGVWDDTMDEDHLLSLHVCHWLAQAFKGGCILYRPVHDPATIWEKSSWLQQLVDRASEHVLACHCQIHLN